MLNIMHNNRAYHQEVMQVQIMADRHSRGIANCGTGTTITAPNIDFAKTRAKHGMYGEGPLSDPKGPGAGDSSRSRRRQARQPALLDVVDAAEIRRFAWGILTCNRLWTIGSPGVAFGAPRLLARFIVVGALIFTSAAAAGQQAEQTLRLPETPQTGKKNFTSDGCYECHGLQGQGRDANRRPPLGPPLLPLESFYQLRSAIPRTRCRPTRARRFPTRI